MVIFGLSSGIPESQVLWLGSGGTGSYGYLNMGTPHLQNRDLRFCWNTKLHISFLLNVQ